MSSMLEHDARAQADVSVEHRAQAHATHERTHERTNAEKLLTAESSPYASRTGGHDSSRTRDPQNPYESLRYVNNHGETMAGIHVGALSCARSGCTCEGTSNPGNAQGSTVRTLVDELKSGPSTATSPLTRRVRVHQVGTQRLRPSLDGLLTSSWWHGRSDGFNPLRPSTWISTASRCRGRLRLTFDSMTQLRQLLATRCVRGAS